MSQHNMLSGSPQLPDNAEENSLWELLAEDPHGPARDDIAVLHLDLVLICAGRLAMHLPSWIHAEDLHGSGSSGLLSAIDRFDSSRGIPFESFARTRIRGAMLDELRALDILPRAAREKAERVRQARRELTESGAATSPQAVSDRAGLTLDEYGDVERALRTTRMASLEVEADNEGHLARSLVADKRAPAPGASMERAEMVDWVKDQLDERERQIIVLYYDQGLTLREVGRVLGVTEGRVSQIHTELLSRLRLKLV